MNRRTEAGAIEAVALRDIHIGDLVESFDLHRGERVFSKVYLLEHSDSPLWTEVRKVQFRAACGRSESITASPCHYVVMSDRSYKTFGEVQVGDEIFVTGSMSAVVTAVSQLASSSPRRFLS